MCHIVVGSYDAAYHNFFVGDKREETISTIKELISVLKNTRQIDEFSKLELCNSLYALLIDYFDNMEELEGQFEACRYAIVYLIPVIENSIEKGSGKYMQEFYSLYEKAFAFAARCSLEHFCDYMEWDKKEKVMAKRRKALKPFVFYLNRSEYDVKLNLIVASYPPSYGKSYCMSMYTAWIFGRNKDGSVIRLSYSDDLVNGFSRQIKETIASDRFSDVFPSFKKYGGKPFDKEKESDWKLKDANAQTNHMARTREGAVTGQRAKKALIIDDITKGEIEATDENLHQRIYTRWHTDFKSRVDDPDKAKFIVGGTMWSPSDLLNRLREDAEKRSKLVPSKNFKFVEETEDGTSVFIRVPALDENDESTLPSVYSSEYYRNLRDDLDPYYFECVYQQSPIPPSGLEFADDLINKYQELPKDEKGNEKCSNYCLAVLDPARKGKDNVSMPIFKTDGELFYMVDCIFKQKAMTELYDEIVEKIIEHRIIRLVIENNTDTSLKELLQMKLREKGINFCTITEKYNTEKKEQRIKDARGNIRKFMAFKDKSKYKQNSDYGKFMKNFTTYSFDYPNKHDDAPDSLALFITQIVLGKGRPNKPKPLDRSKVGF